MKRFVLGLAVTFLSVCLASPPIAQGAEQAASPSCLVTPGNRQKPPDNVVAAFMDGFGGGAPKALWDDIHGNGTIWTWPRGFASWLMPTQSALGRLRQDGTVGSKFMWFVASEDLLTVEVRAVGSVEPTKPQPQTGQYQSFSYRPSTIFFPKVGCYEVTARTKTATLTFTTAVELAPW